MSSRQKFSIISTLILSFLLSCPNPLFAAAESSMSADNINYNINTKKITATGNVVINRKDFTLWGDRGEGSTENQEFILKGNVRGSFTSQKVDLVKAESVKWIGASSGKSEGIAEASGNVLIKRGEKEKLKADYVRWKLGSSDYIARGNVNADLKDHLLESQEVGRSGDRFWGNKVKRYENRVKRIGLTADAVEGKISGGQVAEFIATDNVIVDYLDKDGLKTTVSGAKAVYSKDRGTVVISGGAKAVRGDGKTVTSDTVVLHEDSKIIEAIGNSKITFVITDKNIKKDTDKKEKKTGE